MINHYPINDKDKYWICIILFFSKIFHLLLYYASRSVRTSALCKASWCVIEELQEISIIR